MASCSVRKDYSELMDNNIVRACCLKLAVNEYCSTFHQALDFIKIKQTQALYAAVNSDVIAVLPTGYGKSLVYELLPFFIGALACRQQCKCCGLCTCKISEFKTAVIVISPLNAILMEKLNLYGSEGMRIGASEEQEMVSHRQANLESARFTYILGHPEHFLQKSVLALMKRSEWQEKVSHIIIDEAHCVMTWGHDFRPEYRKLDSLRAMLPYTHILGLTATASRSMQKEIASVLNFNVDFKTVAVSCDRDNIFYSVKQRACHNQDRTPEDAYDAVLMPFIVQLQEEKDTYPKTVIFSKLRWCGYGHEVAKRYMTDDELYSKETASPYTARVGQFHSPQVDDLKKELSKLMRDPKGHLRLLFATESYSMGADAPDIRRVIHIGPPSTLEVFVQQTGRAGRDGEPAEATIYINNSDVATNVKHLSPEMRAYCKTKACRRQLIMQHFGHEYVQPQPPHKCCDNCSQCCHCEDCVIACACDETEFEDIGINLLEITSSVEKPAVKLAENLLCQYFEAENMALNMPCPVLQTGLGSNLSKQLAADYVKFKNQLVLQSYYPHLDYLYIQNIVSILNYVNDQYS